VLDEVGADVYLTGLLKYTLYSIQLLAYKVLTIRRTFEDLPGSPSYTFYPALTILIARM